MPQLRVNEIFFSLQGESRSAGLPTVFVRLTGCPLRCGYCDSGFAFTGGEWMEIPEILAAVAGFEPRHVTVTGGEPLAQGRCLELLSALCDAGYETSLETGGMLDISRVDPRVVRVVDLKTPASGECESNCYDNIRHLRPRDQVKFVICDEADYRWAREQLQQWRLPQRCEALFSPCHGRQDAKELAQWILRDRLPVRFQIQLHKYLWGDERGR
ncbi:MAG TPA: 7-carboxy-7-deazaguanine synthase QueE [Sedimenticola sp.]|nr:7-carboxy-7-deazaguanine synthase QueE [Sedimenticola sp.]